jgi:hypothetical protein
MYAKSPFRKEKIQKRISEVLPKTLNLMAFAFPDGNECENSEESEDDAQPQILNIDKLSSQGTTLNFDGNAKNSSNKDLLSVGSLSQQRFEEPNSAMLRTQIK